MSKVSLVALVLFCGFLGASAQILFKSTAKDLHLSLSLLLNWRLLSGMLLYLVSMVLFLYALRFAAVSTLYPLIASSYIWAALLAYLVLHERLSLSGIFGIGCIVIGLGLLSWKL
jgi:drug/metabolite transporter (DMT)-like permease